MSRPFFVQYNFCASDGGETLLAGAFDECRGRRKALKRNCHGQSIGQTVFFEKPFWGGVFERISEGKLFVCKVTFGAEPKDYEVYDFVLKNYCMLRFNLAVATDIKENPVQRMALCESVKEAVHNPKREQREVEKTVRSTVIDTKSQQALKLQQEQLKTELKTVNWEQREAEKQGQFELKQQKMKERHRGGQYLLQLF